MPSRPVSLLLVIALIVNLTACSTTRNIDPDTLDGADQHVVEEGKEATVVMVDGTRHRGKVLENDAETMVLGTAGNYGWNELRLAWADVDHIEVNKATTFTAVVVAVTSVLILATALLLAAYEGSFPVAAS